MRNTAEDAPWSRGPTVPMGRSVRDHLSAIGDVCERYSTTIPPLTLHGDKPVTQNPGFNSYYREM